MEERRIELGMSWRVVARRAGVAYETVRAARAGEGGISPLTAGRLDRALQWRVGSVERILGGGDPLPDSYVPLDEDEEGTWASFSPEERRIARAFIETLRRSAAERDRDRNGGKESA